MNAVRAKEPTAKVGGPLPFPALYRTLKCPYSVLRLSKLQMWLPHFCRDLFYPASLKSPTKNDWIWQKLVFR